MERGSSEAKAEEKLGEAAANDENTVSTIRTTDTNAHFYDGKSDAGEKLKEASSANAVRDLPDQDPQLDMRLVLLRVRLVLLQDALQRVFTPALLGREILEREHALFALPAKYGGLAIPDPVSIVPTAFSVSLEATATLRHGISTGEDISIHDHHQKCHKVASEASRARDERASLISQEIVASLPTLGSANPIAGSQGQRVGMADRPSTATGGLRPNLDPVPRSTGHTVRSSTRSSALAL